MQRTCDLVRRGRRWVSALGAGLCLIALAGSGVFAQVLLEGDPIPRLTVSSEPSGAVVRLIGEYEWTGTTPWNLSRPVVGLYRVEASMPGYETWHGEVVLGAGGIQDLEIKLSSKSRFKAAVRSMVIPGWGQYYAGSKGKGLAFTIGVLAGGVTSFILHESYRDDVDRFDDAAFAYQNAQSIDDLPALRRTLEARSRDADRSHDRYRIAATITGGLYALSVIDALFFFPDTRVLGTVERADASQTNDEGETMSWLLEVDPLEASSRVGLSLRW